MFCSTFISAEATDHANPMWLYEKSVTDASVMPSAMGSSDRYTCALWNSPKMTAATKTLKIGSDALAVWLRLTLT